jgi:hypothetical protein
MVRVGDCQAANPEIHPAEPRGMGLSWRSRVRPKSDVHQKVLANIEGIAG